MVLDVKQLYRKIIEDPDVVVDNDTSKEELALDMATQRAIQHERNIEANNLGSPISKLLQFLEKANGDEDEIDEDKLKAQLAALSPEALNRFGLNQGVSIDEDDLREDRAFVERQIFNKLSPPKETSSTEEEKENLPDYFGEGEEKHIFDSALYSEDDKSFINHIREVDEAHDGKWSKALKELRDKIDKGEVENPKIGNPPLNVIRTDTRGGATPGSINIDAARAWIKQQGGELAVNAGARGTKDLLSMPANPKDAALSGKDPEQAWADKVHDILGKEGGTEWKAPTAAQMKTGRVISPAHQALDKKTNRQLRELGKHTGKQAEDTLNQAYADEAERLGIDISSAGERPKIEAIKTTKAEATAQKIVRPHRAASRSGPEATAAGVQINEEHQRVIRDIATDASLRDNEREKEHDDAQTTMQDVLAALGQDTSSEVDTSKTSAEAVGEHTGRHVGSTADKDPELRARSVSSTIDDDKEYLSTGDETTQAAHIASAGEKSYRIHRPDGAHTARAHTKWAIWEQESPGGTWKESDFPLYKTKKAARQQFIDDYNRTDRGLHYSELTNLHPEIENQRDVATQRDKEHQEDRAAEARDKATLEARDTAREAKPTLHQSGDSTNLIGNNSTIEHAATSEDGTHHELHLHEDGSATTRRVNTNTGETKHTHYRKSADASGGLKEALEAHNKSLTEGGLDEHEDLSEEAKKANDPLTSAQLIARYAAADVETAMKREAGGTQQEWEKGLADSDKASEEPARAKQAAADEATAEKRFSDYFGGKTTEGASETADAGAEETTPPITGTRRPGEAQYGFRGMPSSKAGVKRGQGKPTTPEDTDTSTDAEPTEGQATLPGFGEEEEPSSTIQSVLDSLNKPTESETEKGERDKVAQTIGAVKGKDGQYEFKGVRRSSRKAKKGEGAPVEPPEDTRRGVDVAAEAREAETGEKIPPEQGAQIDMSVKTQRAQSELGDEAKSRVLDIADRNGIFEYLHDKDPYTHSSPQEARENLAEQDIKELKTTLGKHHEPARKHMLSKEPEEEPVREDRGELLDRLAKEKGTTNDEAFAEAHKHDTNDELKSAHKKLRDSNEAVQKNTARQTEASKLKETKIAALSEAKHKVATMEELPAGTNPIDAQQRTREIMNIAHNHNHNLDTKSRQRLSELTQDAAANGANLKIMVQESKEQALKGGFHDDWLEENAQRITQDHAEHAEYNRHLTGSEGYQDRAEAFERSGAEALVDVDKDGNAAPSEHHSGHDEDGKPKSFGENKPAKILGQSPEQQEAQKAHHDAVQKGDTAAQQSIEEENPHLAGTSKSEAELEQERIDANRPPGPPPTLADGSMAKWNPNTQRWNNPKTLSGIQNGLGDGEVAVMQNGIHAGTADAHLDSPFDTQTGASGHKGNRNVDGSFNNGIVVVSQTGTHAATIHDGPATAKAVGPMGHRQTAAHAMGAAVSGHMDANLGSYLGTMSGKLKDKVVVKDAHQAGSHFGKTGVFGSKTHAPSSKAGFGARAAGVATKVTGLDKFRDRRDRNATKKLKAQSDIEEQRQETQVRRRAMKEEGAGSSEGQATQKMLYKADKQKPSPSKILLRSGKLSPTSKQAIREQIRNAQLIREMEEVVKQ